MFAIVISEKGGAERRELFDKHEIHVGRMQGNDLMLPKGNVSKRHARLIFRDGHVVVTDLRSTNGTYVNGRKIGQATLLGEGDRIYVGDFVLRIELSAAPVNLADPASGEPGGPSPAVRQGNGPTPPRSAFGSDAEFTAPQEAFHFPGGESRESHLATTRPGPTPLAVPRSDPEMPVDDDLARVLALRQVLDAVLGSTDLSSLAAGADADAATAARVEQAVRDQARRLHDERQLGADVKLEDVIADTSRELLGLGPIGLLLDDEDVTEIRAFGPHHVTAIKGDDVSVAGPPFSSESALRRVILRLCRRSHRPLAAGETIVERRLSNGLVLHAILDPASEHAALIVQRRRRAQAGLEDLVRSGMISRAMATLLYGCLTFRHNLLLIGPPAGTAMLLSALVTAGNGHTRAIVLQRDDEVWEIEPSPFLLRIPDAGPETGNLVRAAATLKPERLVVNPLLGQAAASVVSAVGQGTRGVLAVIPAPSVRHALQRLASDLMMALPGCTPEAARARVLGSFDVVAEIARLRDGRDRVTRLAELCVAEGELAPRDIFTFVVARTAAGGALEGSFVPTGVVPKIAEDLAMQGVFDSAVFRRERA